MNRNYKVFIIAYLLFLISNPLFSQITQNVKGKITDKATGIGLPGVVVSINGDDAAKLAASSDANGNYKISGVPIA